MKLKNKKPRFFNTPAFKAFKKDLICGSFAGVMVCLTGHPMDSVKVRM